MNTQDSRITSAATVAGGCEEEALDLRSIAAFELDVDNVRQFELIQELSIGIGKLADLAVAQIEKFRWQRRLADFQYDIACLVQIVAADAQSPAHRAINGA